MTKKKSSAVQDAEVLSQASEQPSGADSRENASLATALDSASAEVQDSPRDAEACAEVGGKGTSGALTTTGEISLNLHSEHETQILTRLRAAHLSASEIYREAQQFASQHLDASSLLKSGEPCLVCNIVEILRTIEVWEPETFCGILSRDEKTRDASERYILNALRTGLVTSSEAADVLSERYHSSADEFERERYQEFADKVRGLLSSLLSQHVYEYTLLQPALTKLCSVLDARTVNHMLYDPAPEVRTSVLRALITRDSLDMNDLTVALILLKEHDDNVSSHVLRLLGKFAVFPEIVIPQVLAIVSSASHGVLTDIFDLFRSYGQAAVEPVISALDDVRDIMEAGVRLVIAQAPLRYTDAMLERVQSVLTPDYVKERLRTILLHHDDPMKRAEIGRILQSVFSGGAEDYPVWTRREPKTPPYAEPATDNTDIYSRHLNDDEIKACSQGMQEREIGRLLGDASDNAKWNALRMLRVAGTQSPSIIHLVSVCMRLAHYDIAMLAFKVYCELEKNTEKATATVIDSILHQENEYIRKDFLLELMKEQEIVSTIIRLYYQSPIQYKNFIIKALLTEPSQETLDGILNGLDRKQSLPCIATTEECLLTSKLNVSSPALCHQLIKLIREPLAFGHFGFLTRLYALRLLKMFYCLEREMHPDYEADRELIQQLQAFYKEAQNAELRDVTKELLKLMGEELFDSDDEDDNFDDLEEDEAPERD